MKSEELDPLWGDILGGKDIRKFRWEPPPEEKYITWKTGDPTPSDDVHFVYVAPKDFVEFSKLLDKKFQS